jgi:integrase
MASIKRRAWTTSKGERREAWVVRYADQDGTWRLKTFERQKDAKEWLPAIQVEVKTGQHVPDSKAPTVAAAAGAWIEQGEVDGLESSTMRQRRLHIDRHIVPLLGADTKLVRADLAAFRNDLLRSCSKPMAKKIMTSFKAILKQAKLAHLAANIDPIEKKGQAKRHKKPLKVGVDIPTAPEVKALIEATAGDPKARALACLAGFAGLRASEMRGLAWPNVKLDQHKVTVEERADENCDIGSPKSGAAHREIGLNATTVEALRAWKLAQPPIVTKDDDGKEIRRPRTLVFGTASDRPDRLPNIHRRLIGPAMVKAGVALQVLDGSGKPVVDKDGKPVMRPKYKKPLHCLRHFAISSWLRTCGGDFKAVQVRAGHATLALTLDTYGHLLDNAGEHDQMAAAEKLVLG